MIATMKIPIAERAASFAPMRDEMADNIFNHQNDPQVAIIGPAERKNSAQHHARRERV
jgi:hypothetical protein